MEKLLVVPICLPPNGELSCHRPFEVTHTYNSFPWYGYSRISLASHSITLEISVGLHPPPHSHILKC